MVNFTLQDLRYAVMVAEYRHFGRAARHCHVSQPTLSTQLKKLEQQLGVKLFERTNKKVAVTTIGERIVKQARKALEAADQVVEIAESHRGPFAEPIRMGVIPTLNPYLLPWVMPGLHRQYPELKLILREDLTDRLLEQLKERELDVALLALPVSAPETVSLPLFEEPFLLVCAPEHELASKGRIAEADLAGHRLLLLTEGHCLRDQALAVCGQDASHEQDGDDFRATSIETLRQLAAAGIGCTLVPKLALSAPENVQANLRAIPLAAKKAKRTIGMVWRRNFSRDNALRLIARSIRESLPEGVHPVLEPRPQPRAGVQGQEAAARPVHSAASPFNPRAGK